MTMSEAAKAQYDAAMMAATLKHGSLVSPDASSYCWLDWSLHKHLAECTVVATPGATVEEDTWDEFQGTFYEGDTSRSGVIVQGVTCACGKIGTGRSIRWEANMQEVAEAVFEEAFGKAT